MNVGTKVRLARDVERYPHFVAEKGRTGIVTRADDEAIVVRLDEPLEGAEEWNNQVQWYHGMFEDANFQEVFAREVEELG